MDDYRINAIMNGFDFEKVCRVMELLDWKWGMDTVSVPTVDELKRCAKYLLTEVAASKGEGSVSTGGFVADKIGKRLELSFRIERAWRD